MPLTLLPAPRIQKAIYTSVEGNVELERGHFYVTTAVNCLLSLTLPEG